MLLLARYVLGGLMVHGLLSTMAIGWIGALLAELIRTLPAIRQGRPPRGWELVASLIQVALGAGAVLFGWERDQSALQVAVMGAAFPLLFSAAVNGAKPPAGSGGHDVAFGERSAWDYLAGRY
ncbi:hypothetical protein ADK66_19005 [Micromonospora sp. NRRL B-16802]|uniref:hypothetical protein n=1 Tax=Micromonospora sp. NRRL B-16802 TaxID=1415541 RepID=UPI0006AE9FC8|nr:hypothetical protein [Micromonospora sp. NRRL B-16802]KOX07676.1 hypothetical protein ADK66_19005 [Micromonospora sp. NRRL B-16802]